MKLKGVSGIDRIIALLKQINLPFAYNHFAEGEAPATPYICYLMPDSNNFSADGVVYHKLNNVNIELYTDKKDLTTEQKIEDILFSNDIFYNKSEVWIESEKLYEVLYKFEMEV